MTLANLWERLRSSLFYVPLMFGILGAVLAEGALLVDANVSDVPALRQVPGTDDRWSACHHLEEIFS